MIWHYGEGKSSPKQRKITIYLPPNSISTETKNFKALETESYRNAKRNEVLAQQETVHLL